jgi:hypothetical protein
MGRALRPIFVVGISSAKPKTRAFVTERTWAYQTKSAFSDKDGTLAQLSGSALPAPWQGGHR